MERTFRRRIPPRSVVSPELARHLAEVSRQIGRQVGVLVTREGLIRNVIVGDAHRLLMPEIGRLRGGPSRFRGLRLVHTHLRGEPLSRDDLNDLALLRLDLVAVQHVGETGEPTGVEVAFVMPPSATDDAEAAPFRFVRAEGVHSLDLDFLAEIRALEDEFSRVTKTAGHRSQRERALIINLVPDDRHLEEVGDLVRAAGVEIAGTVRQDRNKVKAGAVLGRGKLQEVVLEAMQQQAEVAVFDIDLKPAQARNFEDETGLKAIDRTQLILDIFAQRARSRDGRLQVELAQLKYLLPRLTAQDAGLSRLAGGIGGRGPGETTLEIGRRRIRDRIRALEKQLTQLSRQRETRRQRRRRERIPVLSIVGYTNAGKSTLLNALTESAVVAADQLFSTLDPSSRRLRFPREGEVVITDTVGFISDLPSELVTAFKATLEELQDADLLLQVVDVSDSHIGYRIETVNRLLAELELDWIPRVLVLNKCDRLEPAEVERLRERYGGVPVSALRKSGLGELIREAEARLARRIIERTSPPVLVDPVRPPLE